MDLETNRAGKQEVLVSVARGKLLVARTWFARELSTETSWGSRPLRNARAGYATSARPVSSTYSSRRGRPPARSPRWDSRLRT